MWEWGSIFEVLCDLVRLLQIPKCRGSSSFSFLTSRAQVNGGGSESLLQILNTEFELAPPSIMYFEHTRPDLGTIFVESNKLCARHCIFTDYAFSSFEAFVDSLSLVSCTVDLASGNGPTFVRS